MQRGYNKDNAYVQSYIDTITPEDEEKYLGALFRISNDCGLTFGKIHHSPITSPHGPVQLKDGTVMWAGTRFDDIFGGIEVRCLDTESGETELTGKITSSQIASGMTMSGIAQMNIRMSISTLISNPNTILYQEKSLPII